MNSLIESIIEYGKAFAFMGTLIVNAVLLYGVLYGIPFSQILADRSQPYCITCVTPLATAITLAYVAVIITTSIILVIWAYKKQKVFLFAPVFTRSEEHTS